MHRRTFLTAAASSALLPSLVSGQSPVASPMTKGSGLEVKGRPLALSPDGTKIAGIGEEMRSIWITDLDSGKAVQSDEVEVQIIWQSVVWAPDSSAVAFSLNAPVVLRDSDVYLVDAESGTLTDLTDDDPNDTGADHVSIATTPDAADVPVDLYPAWSPDSKNLVFARTMWGKAIVGTSLMTLSRDGGTPEERVVVQPEYPMSIFSPVWWLENDAILFAQWMGDLDHKDNGVWRLEPDDTLTHLIPGDVESGIPGAGIADISPDGTRASIWSELLYRQYGYTLDDDHAIWFDVDLTTGDFEPWKIGDETHKLAAPPVFSPDGASIAAIMVDFAGADTVDTVSIIDDKGAHREIASWAPPSSDAAGGGIGYRLDWADEGGLLVLRPGGVPHLLHP